MTFTTEDGVRLEGEWRLDVADPYGSPVICHPHPKHGGSKDHPLLWAIRNELANRGFGVIAFDFRGVMGSGGTYGGGRAELADARAAVELARSRAPWPTLLCGWSFGASVALREALDDDRVDALALVGIPLRFGDLDLPALPVAAELRVLGRRPVLLLAGENDGYCPGDELKAFGAGFPRAETTVLAGTDHYFWRREREAATVIGEFASRIG